MMTCHVLLLLASVDLPAQAKMLNMKLFNGKFGCGHCEEEGTPRGSSHPHHNWPYKRDIVVRSQESIMQNVRDVQAPMLL